MASAISIEPVVAYWGEQQLDKIKVADADGLAGLFFDFSSIDMLGNIVLGRAWYDDGVASAPVAGGRVLHAIPYDDSTDSPSDVAAASVVIIDAIAGQNSKVVSVSENDSFYIQSGGIGVAGGVVDGDIGALFVFEEIRIGSRLDLGFFDGDVEFGLAQDLKDVLAQQQGTTIIERLITGQNVESVTLPLKEVKDKLIPFLEQGGVKKIIDGASIVGLGQGKQFQATSDLSKRLILHSARIKDQSIVDTDWCFMRAYPTMESLNFSGETEQLANIQFSFLPDSFVDSDLEMVTFGDHTKNMLK